MTLLESLLLGPLRFAVFRDRRFPRAMTLLESLLLGRCPDSVAAFTERPEPKTPRERLQHAARRNDCAMRRVVGDSAQGAMSAFDWKFWSGDACAQVLKVRR